MNAIEINAKVDDAQATPRLSYIAVANKGCVEVSKLYRLQRAKAYETSSEAASEKVIPRE